MSALFLYISIICLNSSNEIYSSKMARATNLHVLVSVDLLDERLNGLLVTHAPEYASQLVHRYLSVLVLSPEDSGAGDSTES